MSSQEIGGLALTLCILLALVHLLGMLFHWLKQPRLIGEILAGILLGPFVLGKITPDFSNQLFAAPPTQISLQFLYWIGLFLLMFIAGSETRRLLGSETQRQVGWLLGVGTPLPFFIVLGLGLTSVIPLEQLTGDAGQIHSTLLVLACAAAVTSIPVISRIFHDLGIMHTRFAGIILGAAVLEDILLWGVLAIATGLAQGAQNPMHSTFNHVLITTGFMLAGLTVLPWCLRRLHNTRWNALIKASPLGYVLFLLFSYTATAAALDVNLVFAAFLAGFGLVGGIERDQHERFAPHLEALIKVGQALFIPLYFALVGYRLQWGHEFSASMFLYFLVGSSLLCLFSVGLAAYLAGFRRLGLINLAITANARGGPGIVLASVAYEAGIINASFYTTLVLTAVITSQLAGAWLRFVLDRGLPLLEEK